VSALDDINRWSHEEPTSPKDVEFHVVRAPAFKARGHGSWAWKKGMKADRGAHSVVDYRDEKHLWLMPRSKFRRKVNKSDMVNEAIKSAGHIITLADRKR